MPRFTVIFRKSEGARFLSHLDLMATFEYAVRRARLPVELSEGYNPRPRLSAASPLPVGYIGEQEILEIALRENLSPTEIGERLQRAVPRGIQVLAVEPQDPGAKPAASRLWRAIYRVELRSPVPDLPRRLAGLMRRKTIPVEERREAGVRSRDIRPLIHLLEATGGNRELLMTVGIDPSGTVRADQILHLLSIPADGVRVTRERIELQP